MDIPKDKVFEAAAKLAHEYVKKRIDGVIKNIESFDEDFRFSSKEAMALAKHLEVAYSMGYADGDNGTVIKKLFI
jgi:hypothetical protein